MRPNPPNEHSLPAPARRRRRLLGRMWGAAMVAAAFAAVAVGEGLRFGDWGPRFR